MGLAGESDGRDSHIGNYTPGSRRRGSWASCQDRCVYIYIYIYIMYNIIYNTIHIYIYIYVL